MHLLTLFKELSLQPQSTADLRGLILDLATRGRLTADWRKANPEVEPASALLERIQAEKARLVREKKIRTGKPLPPIEVEEVPFELPEGWVWSRLGAITINRDGERKPITKSERVSGPYDYYGASGVIDKVNDYLFEKDLLLIGEDGANLVNRSTPIAFFARGKYWVNNHAHVLDATDFQILEFLEKYINSISLEEYLTGMAQPKLPQKRMNPILVPLPPLPEQRAIVQVVDQLLAEVDALEAQLQRRVQLKDDYVTAALRQLTTQASAPAWAALQPHFKAAFASPARVDQLRQAILQLAVQGQLTAPWRAQHPDTEPASLLLERIKARKARLVKEKKIRKEKLLPPVEGEEVPFESPEGWVWCRMGEVVLDIEAGKSPKCINIPASNNDWGVIKMSAISWGEFRPEENKTLPNHIEPFLEKEIKAGDFILTRANTAELIARSVIVPPEVRGRLLLNDKTLRFSFTSKANVKYLNLYNNCEVARQYYLQVASGTSDSMKNISRANIKKLRIPLPPLAEQRAIVALVDQLLGWCADLEAALGEQAVLVGNLRTAAVREVMGA